MKRYLVIILILVGFSSWGQVPELDCLDTPTKNQSIVRLKENQNAKSIAGSENFEKYNISLYADPSAKSKYDYLIGGFKLYIVNDTDSVVNISCLGSTFEIVCEAKTEKGEWKEIELPSRSWCGNMYSEFPLGAHQFVWVPVACYTGSMTTKLRYKMRVWRNVYIYSNEIFGEINPGQMLY